MRILEPYTLGCSPSLRLFSLMIWRFETVLCASGYPNERASSLDPFTRRDGFLIIFFSRLTDWVTR